MWEKGAAWKWAVKLRIMSPRYLFLFLISLLSPWHVLCVLDNLIVALWVMLWRDSTHPSTAWKSISASKTWLQWSLTGRKQRIQSWWKLHQNHQDIKSSSRDFSAESPRDLSIFFQRFFTKITKRSRSSFQGFTMNHPILEARHMFNLFLNGGMHFCVGRSCAGDQAWFSGEAGCWKCTGAESNMLAAQLHELVEKADKVVEANQKWLEAINRIPGEKLTWARHPLGMEYITWNQCLGVLIDWI